jgi:hypothetical protein
MRLEMTVKLFLALTLLASGAALVGLRAQTDPQASQQSPAQPGAARQHDHSDSMPGMNMDGMKMDDDSTNHAQTGAMQSMAHSHHMAMDAAHMRMTPARPVADGDRERAQQIVDALAPAIQKYKDYRVALAEGYRIFAPNVPQPVYHFTNYWNGFLEGFTFDPARPTSLLYKKTKDGYELVGAMYTAPKTATLDELNERVPLGIARWHQHTNLCIPKAPQARRADWSKFGLTGSISTEQACSEAGGRFYPVIFGWMVHVYPFESSSAQIWAQ